MSLKWGNQWLRKSTSKRSIKFTQEEENITNYTGIVASGGWIAVFVTL
jgi:hypothetical protein